MPIGPLGDVGPCQIDWNSTAITSVMEAATFRYTMGFVDVKEAEHGVCAVDAVFQGTEVAEFECPLTRVTYGNLASLIPGATQSGGESGNIEVFSNRVGTSMYDSAQELIVKRIIDGAVTAAQDNWLHIVKTYPVPQFDIPYNLDGQRAFMVLFKAFPDSTGLIWHVGDKSA